jgi:exopolyphosphatase/pppGpp-phosphohydrolase
MIPTKAAIIDMGTNTFHLLLVELYADRFETIYKEKIPVKIGQGGISRNTIHPDAEKRAFHTLQHFRNLIDGKGSPVFLLLLRAGSEMLTTEKNLLPKLKTNSKLMY